MSWAAHCVNLLQLKTKWSCSDLTLNGCCFVHALAENVHGKENRALRKYRLLICSKVLTSKIGFSWSVFCCFEGARTFGRIIFHLFMFAFSEVIYMYNFFFSFFYTSWFIAHLHLTTCSRELFNHFLYQHNQGQDIYQWLSKFFLLNKISHILWHAPSNCTYIRS